MSALAFAWRGLVRQPARAALGIVGVAAVGALLFDMLLLSRGLVLSMRDLLNRGGFDVRVTATPSLPGNGPRVRRASQTATELMALPDVEEAVPLLLAQAEIDSREPFVASLFGANSSRRRPWTVVEGRDVTGTGAPTGQILLNRRLATALKRRLGETMTLRVSCDSGTSAVPPMTLRVVGVAEFPFDAAAEMSAATTIGDIVRACGDKGRDEADLLLVASAEGRGADQARAAIHARMPDLHVLTNEQVLAGLQQTEFSYLRQISTVLTTVTFSFAFLLITVLLTVSVNQRLGEIAALRALGFSQYRVAADVICESALIVGLGGAIALPLGIALARWLDRILKTMPGIPVELHFFVFEPRVVLVHVALLTATAILAALYPMGIVARLPIAATLRNEVIS